MIKKLTTVILLLASFLGFSNEIDTIKHTFKENQIHHITNHKNSELIIFLHGGVSNPYFKENRSSIDLSFVLENNLEFVPLSLEAGYDLVFPITNDTLNWIKNPQSTHNILNQFLIANNLQYEKIYIAGFSDGGTASFKIFYLNTNSYSGLIVFNGYPQHQYFTKNVDYSQTKTQPIIFFGTTKDNTTPYEFMLTEYCKQKENNANTYLYITEGKHSFSHYTQKEFKELFNILEGKIYNQKKEAIHGYIRNDKLITFYEFRKSILRKYGYGKEYFEVNKKQSKQHKK